MRWGELTDIRHIIELALRLESAERTLSFPGPLEKVQDILLGLKGGLAKYASTGMVILSAMLFARGKCH